MKNPWVHLPKKAPFILLEDQQLLSSIIRNTDDRTQLRFEVVPLPFIGNPVSAEVILLALNPGFADDDVYYQNTNQSLFTDSINSLTHICDYPFYLLKEVYQGTPGYNWYNGRLKQLIEATDRETVSKKVAIVQYFPYHSREFKPLRSIIPSQAYNFSLVRKAIKMEKVIIYMRSKKIWEIAIPELASYPTMQLKSYRAPYLTGKNLGYEAFEKLIELLKQ